MKNMHQLKSWHDSFEATWNGIKLYDLRINDRNYAVGDMLIFKEYDPNLKGSEYERYSGREITAIVTYMTHGGMFGLPDNLCILGIKTLGRSIGRVGHVLSKSEDLKES